MTEEDRAPIRSDFFTRIFAICKRTISEVFGDAEFDEDDAACLADLYFAMSDCYKDWRLKDPIEHRTNDYKKAAITIAAVMAMRPVRFVIPKDDLRSLFVNQVFGLACATGILNRPSAKYGRGRPHPILSLA